jgi:hypothetical protein
MLGSLPDLLGLDYTGELMMTSSRHCTSKAEECARLGRCAETLPMRVALSNTERIWIRLADQCQRLGELTQLVAQTWPAGGLQQYDSAAVPISQLNRAVPGLE